MIINIPENVYGINISDAEIVEYDTDKVDYCFDLPNTDCALEVVYVLLKNGSRIGNQKVRYLSKTDENFNEENLKGFFIDWFSSINSNE